MELLALPAFTDNYIWMIHNGQEALVVDPGDASPVIQTLNQNGLKLKAILVTHRHADHIAGIAALQPYLDGPIYGPESLQNSGVNHPVYEGDQITFGPLTFHVWETPGHTAEHLSFFCEQLMLAHQSTPVLFCGDTLFSAGCGRVFDGHPELLWQSLNRLAQLPEQTKICPAHEYTLSNLDFAEAAEPSNPALHTHRQHCLNLRGRHLPTLPTTLLVERQINPYLRLTEPEIISQARMHGATTEQPEAVFIALRAWKNTF
ncbi:MAG: hydroxyacylglutathione hydrolase [Aquabacterium sp.]|jgi:hydroxyacylglutathione hydrolase|nr:hydroxyacylglutathione hydrolase [Aquabacterium sp.]